MEEVYDFLNFIGKQALDRVNETQVTLEQNLHCIELPSVVNQSPHIITTLHELEPVFKVANA